LPLFPNGKESELTHQFRVSSFAQSFARSQTAQPYLAFATSKDRILHLLLAYTGHYPESAARTPLGSIFRSPSTLAILEPLLLPLLRLPFASD
jgi:hypothetical protein